MQLILPIYDAHITNPQYLVNWILSLGYRMALSTKQNFAANYTFFQETSSRRQNHMKKVSEDKSMKGKPETLNNYNSRLSDVLPKQ